MASLNGQTIASSYEQLLHVDRDGGGNGTTHVSIKDGDNDTTFGFTIATDALMMTSTNRLEFGDNASYIHQSADGVLDLVSDTEIELNATTIDINGAVDMSSTLTVADDVNFDSNTLFVDASESKVGIGTSSPTLATTQIQDGDLAIVANSADANSKSMLFYKSRNATDAGHTIVQDGDDLGIIKWVGSDGGDWIRAAQILAEIDGTPGDDDMPGRIVFQTTPDGGITPAEAMRINSSKQVTMQSRLTLANDGSDNGLFLGGGWQIFDNASEAFGTAGDLVFYHGASRVVMTDTGEMGIGGTPDTILDLHGASGTSPILQMRNLTHEDNDTGRETSLRFSGERSGGEAVSNAQISGHHDGSADDDDGMLIFWTNTGSGLSEKLRINAEGKHTISANNDGDYGLFVNNSHATGWGVRVAAGADNGDYIIRGQNENGDEKFIVTSAGEVGINRLPQSSFEFDMLPASGNANFRMAATATNQGSRMSLQAHSGDKNQIEFCDSSDQAQKGAIDSTVSSGEMVISATGDIKLSCGGSNSVYSLGAGGTTNTAFGQHAGNALNGSSGFNTLFGIEAGGAITSAQNNTLVGYQAGKTITSGGNHNTAVGVNALVSLTDGDENVAIGASAMLNAITCTNNVAVGSDAALNFAGSATDNGEDNNVAIGQQAMRNVDGGSNNNALVRGNIAIGKETLMGGDFGSSDLNLDYNIAIGQSALNSTGTSQLTGVIAIGASAGTAINSNDASGTVIVGHQAGMAITSAQYNTFIGHEAGKVIQTGDENVAVGFNSGAALIGNKNTLLGYQAGVSLNGIGDTNNTLIGRSAGQSISNNSNNTIVGANADGTNTSNSNIFGSNVVGTSNTFTCGEGSNDFRIDNTGNSISNPSDRRIKRNIEDSTLGLSFVNDLKPRTYNWALKGDLPEYHSDYVKDSTEQWRNDKKVHGFIAQELKEAIDKAGDDVGDGFEAWGINEHNDLQRVSMISMIPVLVKAIQELSAKVTELENKLGE